MAKEKASAAANKPIAHAVGRRKKAVARAWVRRGTGTIKVNNKEYTHYFDTARTQMIAATPMGVYKDSNVLSIDINVHGGGKVGQAHAVKLAIARAFVEHDSELRPVMRQQGLLTVDSRVKERKKYGQKGARRKFQFVKR